MNNVKELLEKLNEEFEKLQAENRELKLRLKKYEEYETIENNENLTLDNMNLSRRSYNTLMKAGLRTVADVLKLNANTLHGITGLGKLSYEEIIEKMQELGFNDWANEMMSE